MDAPTIVEARIVRHPTSGADCLLALDGEGRRLAFAFEAAGEAPGLSIVDPGLWLEAAADGVPEESAQRFDVFEQAWADDFLPAIVSDPVGREWLSGIKASHPEAYHAWFAQTHYEEGGEEGAG
jgi:hypothetical protein